MKWNLFSFSPGKKKRAVWVIDGSEFEVGFLNEPGQDVEQLMIERFSRAFDNQILDILEDGIERESVPNEMGFIR